MVLTRKGGEGTDLPQDMAGYSGSEAGRSYLELTPNEEDLLAMVEENFSNGGRAELSQCHGAGLS